MSFDKIFDLTAGVYFNFYNIVTTSTNVVSASARYDSVLAGDVYHLYQLGPEDRFIQHASAATTVMLMSMYA